MALDVNRHISEDSASLRALIDTIVDGVVIIDYRGLIRVFNPACEKLFGYEAAEVVGQNVSMLMPEPYRSEHDSYLDAYHRTGEKRIIGIGREVVGRRKDGSTFPMELSVGETMLGTGNAYVGIIRDITARREAERCLRDGEARLRAVIDTVIDGVVMIDNRGVIRLFNPASEWIFGYRAREVLGKNVKVLMPEPYQGEHDNYLAHYRATGERRIIGIGREVLGRRKNGDVFPMELSVGETVQSGEQVFVGVVRDISDRKSAEEDLRRARDEALAASKSKSVLLMELNHRVRNNLMLILSVMRLQRRRISDPAAIEAMDNLSRRVESVGAVQNLMFEAEAFGMLDREIIRQIVEAVCGAFAGSPIKVVPEIGQGVALPSRVATPLTMILTELLLNAFKHAFPESHPDPCIEVKLQREDENMLLVVRDNGKGMKPDEQRPGSLGFWLVQLLTEQISGDLRYDIDGGTLVSIRFPAPAEPPDRA